MIRERKWVMQSHTAGGRGRPGPSLFHPQLGFSPPASPGTPALGAPLRSLVTSVPHLSLDPSSQDRLRAMRSSQPSFSSTQLCLQKKLGCQCLQWLSLITPNCALALPGRRCNTSFRWVVISLTYLSPLTWRLYLFPLSIVMPVSRTAPGMQQALIDICWMNKGMLCVQESA